MIFYERICKFCCISFFRMPYLCIVQFVWKKRRFLRRSCRKKKFINPDEWRDWLNYWLNYDILLYENHIILSNFISLCLISIQKSTLELDSKHGIKVIFLLLFTLESLAVLHLIWRWKNWSKVFQGENQLCMLGLVHMACIFLKSFLTIRFPTVSYASVHAAPNWSLSAFEKRLHETERS